MKPLKSLMSTEIKIMIYFLWKNLKNREICDFIQNTLLEKEK